MINAQPESVWRVPGMGALAAMTLLGFTGFGALMPVVPMWAVHGGADAAGAGLVNAVLLGATIAGQPFVSSLLTRVGWRTLLISGLILLGVPSVVQTLSDGLGFVLGCSVFRGLGFAVLTVSGSSAVARLTPPQRRGEGIGTYGLALAVPNVVVLPLAPWLVDQLGYGPVFVVGAAPLLGLPAAASLGALLDHQARPAPVTFEGEPSTPSDAGEQATAGDPVWEDTSSSRSVLTALTRPTMLLLIVTVAGGGVLTFLPQYVPTSWLSTLTLFLFGLVAAVTRWRAGVLADRRGAHGLLLPLTCATVVGLALFAAAGSVTGWAQAAVLTLAALVLGLSYGSLQNLTLVLAFAAVPRRRVDTASAVWNIGFDAGTALGSLVVGLLAAGMSFAVAFGVLAVLSVPGVLLARGKTNP